MTTEEAIQCVMAIGDGESPSSRVGKLRREAILIVCDEANRGRTIPELTGNCLSRGRRLINTLNNSDADTHAWLEWSRANAKETLEFALRFLRGDTHCECCVEYECDCMEGLTWE